MWSTLLGGTGFDWARAVDLGPDGTAYVAGDTNTSNGSFPSTPGSFDPTHNLGNHDGFVAHLSGDGSRLVYSGFIGSDGLDALRSVAVDRLGNAYVGGDVPGYGRGFPVTPGAFDTTQQSDEGFVVKIRTGGASIAWGTYLGGLSYRDVVSDVAVDPQGSVYAVGLTNSYDFPVTSNAFQRTIANASVDGFVTKLDPSGSFVVGSTFIGGEDDDSIAAVAIDRGGAAAIAGVTRSDEFRLLRATRPAPSPVRSRHPPGAVCPTPSRPGS